MSFRRLLTDPYLEKGLSSIIANPVEGYGKEPESDMTIIFQRLDLFKGLEEYLLGEILCVHPGAGAVIYRPENVTIESSGDSLKCFPVSFSCLSQHL